MNSLLPHTQHGLVLAGVKAKPSASDRRTVVVAVGVTDAYETGRPAEVDFRRVATREDVIGVVLAMLEDLREHPDAWENRTLDRFLEALAASMEGIEYAYVNRGEVLPDQPNWKLVAELLVTASGYE